MEPKEECIHRRRRNIFLGSVLGFAFFIVIVWFLYWLIYGQFHVKTDDAYVHGNKLSLTPQISSGVAAIFAEETNFVEQGQLVVKLSTEESLITFNKLKEELGSTVRQVSGYFHDAEAKQAELELTRANLRQAELDLLHREGLAQTGAISKEEYEQYQTNVIVREAEVEAAQKELEKAEALIVDVTVETHPEVLTMVTKLRQAYYNIIRCNILAPMSGYIAKRSVQVGDYIREGETMLEIVPLNYLWVEANFRENRLKRIRIDQPVTFTADMHGRGVKYHGRVVGLTAGSGNAFALLPPENASGNWIKVIQRVPVRISIDPAEILQNPLVLGVSIHINVDAHDTKGSMIAQTATQFPLYTTDIYKEQYEKINEIMPILDQIIQENQY
ncbi:MAG: putative multidrug resistance protein EmrK [Chlamydiales bacterium]|nr:putative multidrug resistance protein EmrK [Chlamydiales bacterium]MCH9620052.1 putative multidrug resistance protein EmrK [Chlamydiales bacterium]MCH9623529.1 putative multidrug resistance protein EmrK [Chlamydiales bacterium]